MSFFDKVVLVTGAGSGIGAATTELFAKEGASVVAVDLDENGLRQVVQKCNDYATLNGGNISNGNATRNGNANNGRHDVNAAEIITVVANIAKDVDAKRIIDETIGKLGILDVLVNCAGIYREGTISDGSLLKTYDDVLNVNLRAVVQLTTLAAPHLIKSKGNVVNISSVKAMAISTSYAYDISKVGIEHFTRRAALELGPLGVRVNAVRPGPVRTNIIKNSGVDIDTEGWAAMTVLDRVSAPEEVAEHILFLAKAKGITGSVLTHDNGTLVKYCAS